MSFTAKYFLSLFLDNKSYFLSRITTAQKIKELNDRFKNSETFSIGELYMYYKEFDNSLTMNSVRVRIARFVKSGILKKLGGGIYTFEKKEGYFPEVNNKLKALYKKLNKKFPLLKFCVWHTSALNEFMQHQPFRFYTIIETEEDGLESVFDFLRRQIPNLFLIPDQNTLYRYTSEKNDSAVIINLVSEAPIMEINAAMVASVSDTSTA